MDLSQDSSITNITNCCNQPLQSLGPTNWPAIIRRRSKGSRAMTRRSLACCQDGIGPTLLTRSPFG